MNKIEELVYKIVKKNPKIKTGVRDIYQFLLSLVPTKSIRTDYNIVCRKGYYFGFHDKSPWSHNNEYLLANKFSIGNRKILSTDTIEIGYFNGEQFLNFNSLTKTSTFNWQQGCMLQWVGVKNHIIFNDFDGKEHISKIIDVNGNLIKALPQPIAAVSSDGKYGLSYNFSRLTKYAPGYGYENGYDPELNTQMPECNGIWLIDIENGSITKLFSVKDIASIKQDKTMEGAYHYFTHCLFSPSNKRFTFYHRWIKNMNFVNTRMFSCDLQGNDLFCFPTSGMVSHYGWRNAEEILAYANIDGVDGYYLLNDKQNSFSRIGHQFFNSDGHPSFNPVNSNKIITDTYPDRFRRSYLMMFDLQYNVKKNLAILRQPLQFREELRCDLHPRWSKNGKLVCFDSAHQGIRSLCTIELDNN